MNPAQHPTEAGRKVPYWAAASLGAGAGAITWWLTSISADRGDYHLIGPYHIPLVIEYLVGGTAVALALAALRAAARSTQGRGAISRSTTAVLVLTAMTAAGLWRIMTAGVVGANIGGGMAAVAGPLLIAALLFAAVCAQRYTSGMRTRTFIGLSVLTWCTGPILCATVWFGLVP